MNIRINKKYSIKSDPMNFIIVEHYKSDKEKTLGQWMEKNLGYFPDLSQALRRLIMLDVCMSEVNCLKSLDERITALNNEITEAFGGLKT